jgi:hypothetical protein
LLVRNYFGRHATVNLLALKRAAQGQRVKAQGVDRPRDSLTGLRDFLERIFCE